MRCLVARVEARLVHAREDVRRERRRPGAREPQLELDLVAQLRHRHAWHDVRRDRRHRLLDRPARSSHRVELLLGLHAAEVVDERRPRPESLEAEDAAEIERRLSPDAVADRDRAGLPEALRDPLEDAEAVVGL